MSLASYLYDLRTQRGLSLRQAAARCGLSHVSLFAMERGEQTPSVEKLLGIARGYEVDVQSLVDRCAADLAPTQGADPSDGDHPAANQQPPTTPESADRRAS